MKNSRSKNQVKRITKKELKAQLVLKWSETNSKVQALGKAMQQKAVSFGLPAAITCPMAGWCKNICFAEGGHYVRHSAKACRAHNHAQVKQDNFAETLLHDVDILHKINVRIIRIHDSGDFFHPSYLKAWIAAAASQPDIVMYAYTKSVPWILKETETLPENFRFVQSEGGVCDSKINRNHPWARVYPDQESLDEAIATLEVMWDGSETDEYAMKGFTGGIGLVFHGSHGSKRDVETLRAN